MSLHVFAVILQQLRVNHPRDNLLWFNSVPSIYGYKTHCKVLVRMLSPALELSNFFLDRIKNLASYLWTQDENFFF